MPSLQHVAALPFTARSLLRLRQCAAFALLTLTVALSQPAKTVYLSIRVDDVFMRESSLTPPEIDGFLEVCERHGAKVILAVIPRRLEEAPNADGRMARTLREAVKRGHMVAMHGYEHQCARCGSTGHEFDCPSKGRLAYAGQLDQLTRGKRLLEAAAGVSVSTYVSPGGDDPLDRQTGEILQKIGIRWVTDTLVTMPTFRADFCRVPDLPEYTWDLADSTYERSLGKARTEFAAAVQRGNFFGFSLHDHFTRRAFRNGIVLRWTDEFLTFLQETPGIRIRFITNDILDPSWFSPDREKSNR